MYVYFIILCILIYTIWFYSKVSYLTFDEIKKLNKLNKTVVILEFDEPFIYKKIYDNVIFGKLYNQNNFNNKKLITIYFPKGRPVKATFDDLEEILLLPK